MMSSSFGTAYSGICGDCIRNCDGTGVVVVVVAPVTAGSVVVVVVVAVALPHNTA